MSNRQEVLHKEIDLIQDCIKRMANNSFLLKGWTVSLVAIVLALGKDYDYMWLFAILMLITSCFWYLDAFFLRSEKIYREMYKWTIENRHKSDEGFYDLSPQRFNKSIEGEFAVMFTKTLRIFYGVPFLMYVFGLLHHSKTIQLLVDIFK